MFTSIRKSPPVSQSQRLIEELNSFLRSWVNGPSVLLQIFEGQRHPPQWWNSSSEVQSSQSQSSPVQSSHSESQSSQSQSSPVQSAHSEQQLHSSQSSSQQSTVPPQQHSPSTVSQWPQTGASVSSSACTNANVPTAARHSTISIVRFINVPFCSSCTGGYYPIRDIFLSVPGNIHSVYLSDFPVSGICFHLCTLFFSFRGTFVQVNYFAFYSQLIEKLY